MEVSISNDITSKIPDFKIGIIQYKDIHISNSPQMLKGRLQLFQESLFFDLENKNINDVEGIYEWRSIFKTFGRDPNRYRPSIDSLYRRIKKQNYLQTHNSATDINNFFSLKYQIPIGIYDCNSLQEKIEIRLGKEDDHYQGLNGRMISLEDLIVSADVTGAFGSPYVDSEKTAVTHSTAHAIQIVYLRYSTSTIDSKELLQSLADMFVQIHGGESTYSIVQ